MINNFINMDSCVPAKQRKPILCEPRGLIMPNELVLADNINNALDEIRKQMRLFNDSSCLLQDYIEYYGWVGVVPESVLSQEAIAKGCGVLKWEELQLNCMSVPPTGLTWGDIECGFGESVDCISYGDNECARTTCFGKYCFDWSWGKLKTENSYLPITWKRTRSGESHAKTWTYEECGTDNTADCNEGVWNVNLPYIDENYDPLKVCTQEKRCIYTGIATKDNIIYATRRTSVCVLSSDYNSTLIGARQWLDSSIGFIDLCGIALDSNNTFFVVDRTLCRVAGYKLGATPQAPWVLTNTWGEVGPRVLPNRFYKPNDIHIDKYDTVWVTDTGNMCVKHFTNTGNWLKTVSDDVLLGNAPQSVAVDELDRLHVLTVNNIRVYDYTGNFLFEYDIDTTSQPKKINTNYNKQLIYVTYEKTVSIYTRNGLAFNYLFNNRFCGVGSSVEGVYQDRYRNTHVAYGDKIFKFIHILKQKETKSSVPEEFWRELSTTVIDKDEYIQDWVYNKVFQRTWDSIEAFRSTLFYDTTYCKGYRKPQYSKDAVCIGQNETVTSVVINRCLRYLWANLCSVYYYFDTTCEEPIKDTIICSKPTISWKLNSLRSTGIQDTTTIGIDEPIPTINSSILQTEDYWSISQDKLNATYKMQPTCNAGKTVYGSASATITTKNCETALEIKLKGSSIKTVNSEERFTVYINGSSILVAIPSNTSPYLINQYECVSLPVNVYQVISPRILLQPEVVNTVVIETSKFNSVAHKESYYEVSLTLTT